MSAEYHKIQTVWLRDPATSFKTLLDGQWAKPEFDYLRNLSWTWTEKVDGTNVRLIVDGDASRIGGKTDNATLHPQLLARCGTILTAARAAGLDGLTLYGEGHGAGIQKGGGNYSQAKEFVLFDVCTKEGLWLERRDVEDIAVKCGILVVPVVGSGSLPDAVKMVRAGFNSTWGPFPAEGLVMRPLTELRNRRGERIITKLKHKDFAASAEAEVAA